VKKSHEQVRDRQRAKELLISELRLEISPEEIRDTEPIFGAGLGLDSIDALAEFILAERPDAR
jgi:acyl carrier protein